MESPKFSAALRDTVTRPVLELRPVLRDWDVYAVMVQISKHFRTKRSCCVNTSVIASFNYLVFGSFASFLPRKSF